jgi:hypothetical protein
VAAVRTEVGAELARVTGHRVRSMTVTIAGLRSARPAAARLH